MVARKAKVCVTVMELKRLGSELRKNCTSQCKKPGCGKHHAISLECSCGAVACKGAD